MSEIDTLKHEIGHSEISALEKLKELNEERSQNKCLKLEVDNLGLKIDRLLASFQEEKEMYMEQIDQLREQLQTAEKRLREDYCAGPVVHSDLETVDAPLLTRHTNSENETIQEETEKEAKKSHELHSIQPWCSSPYMESDGCIVENILNDPDRMCESIFREIEKCESEEVK